VVGKRFRNGFIDRIKMICLDKGAYFNSLRELRGGRRTIEVDAHRPPVTDRLEPFMFVQGAAFFISGGHEVTEENAQVRFGLCHFGAGAFLQRAEQRRADPPILEPWMDIAIALIAGVTGTGKELLVANHLSRGVRHHPDIALEVKVRLPFRSEFRGRDGIGVANGAN
jgi:hypothetical protein